MKHTQKRSEKATLCPEIKTKPDTEQTPRMEILDRDIKITMKNLLKNLGRQVARMKRWSNDCGEMIIIEKVK